MPPRKRRPAASGDTLHVVHLADRPSGSIGVEVDGVAPDWFQVRQPPALPDGVVRFVDSPFSGATLRTAKARPPVLPTGGWSRQLVVTRAIAGELFAPLDGDEVALRPALLCDKRGVIDADGYVLVDVLARAPIDPRAADATFEHGFLHELRELAWSPDRRPRARLFRLLELPQLLIADGALADALVDAAPKHIALDEIDHDAGAQFPPGWSIATLPPFAASAAVEQEAEEGYFALARGEAPGRAAALRHPRWAYAVARCLDRAPADDTRASCLRHPLWAALYAVEVDRVGRDDTRRAAQTHGLSVELYAGALDGTIPPALRALVIRDAGHDESTLAQLEAQLAAIRSHPRAGDAGGGGGDGPARVITRREFAAHEAPRYVVEAGRDFSPPSEALRSDIDAFIPRGYARLGYDGAVEPPIAELLDRLHAFVAEVQSGDRAIKSPKERTTIHMELGCALGEQLRRALGWQWASLRWDDGEGVGLVSPARTHAVLPLAVVAAQCVRKARRNAIALLFNMLVDGNLPPASPGRCTVVS